MSKRLTYEELEQRVRELEASRALREQGSLDQIIESIQAGVVVHGSDGAVMKSNTAAQKMLGLTHEQMLGKELIDPAWTFLREDGTPMPVEEYPVSRVIATKKPVHNLMAGIRRSDKAEPVWVLDTAIPEFAEDGRISQIVTTFMDIGALKKSEEKYRKLHEDAAIGIFHSTFDGRFLDVNPALAKMLGYETPQEVVDSIYSISEQIYVDPQARDEAAAQSLAKGETVKEENRCRRKDGSEWIAYFHLRYVFDLNGQPIFLEGFVEDITERKRAEQAIKYHQRHLEALHDIGVLSNSTLDLPTLLQRILQGAVDAVDTTVGMIFLKDRTSGQLSWGASVGLSDAFVTAYEHTLIEPGEGLTGRIADTGQPIFIRRD